MLVMTRVTAAAAARPTRIPAALRRSPWPTIKLEDAGRGGAQRHADADFGGALPDQGCQDTIETDSGEEGGDGGEYADQQQLESRAGLGAFHEGVHRLEFHQHHVGIVLRDGGADGGGELGGVAIDAKRPAVDSSMVDVAVGEVDLFAAGGGERGTAHVSGHADDLDPLRFELAYADQDALADGGLVGEGFGGEQLIHHGQFAVGALSASVKPRPAISGVCMVSK